MRRGGEASSFIRYCAIIHPDSKQVASSLQPAEAAPIGALNANDSSRVTSEPPGTRYYQTHPLVLRG